MYTVLLVDDEESVLNVLEASIDWQELGVDTLLKAADGRAALDLFEQRQIDLLVTDIQMPIMGGIELIRNVRRLRPDTHCVLLTAYSEFEYAQEAIRLGVDNYLLKPVAKDEIAQTIQTALDNVYQHRENSATLLKENTLRRWVAGSIGSEELGERAVVTGLNLYQSAYCTVCMVKRSSASIALFRANCAQMLQQKCDVYCFWDEKGRFVMVLGGKNLSQEELAQNLEQLVDDMGMAHSILVVIGPLVNQAELLHSSYQSACDAIEMTDLSSCGPVICSSPKIQQFDTDLLAEEIRTIFYSLSLQERLNDSRRLVSRMLKSGPEAASQLARACLYVLVREFPMEHDLQQRARQQVRVDEGATGMMEILDQARLFFDECFSKFSPMIQRAIRSIRSGVSKGESVSIKEFCATSGVTPAHLGHIFKKETGMFFGDYLLQCRMNRSIVLLQDPGNKIKDIAEALGFTSTSYYVKCFREYKGVSPAKYRQDGSSAGEAG